jgi:pimeloyl-ACP methyl ester carboxylesterase
MNVTITTVGQDDQARAAGIAETAPARPAKVLTDNNERWCGSLRRHDKADSSDAPVREFARRWLRCLTCLGLATAALAGCDGSMDHHADSTPHVTPTTTSSPFGAADWSCLSPRERGQMFVLRGPGQDRLAALSVGTGPVAVILAHQVAGSLCQWWPYGRTLAAAGFRVVAFDFDGCGASPPGDSDYPGEVAAAAGWARHAGAKKIILMGGSMGGTAVMVAAARLGGSAAGVIDLSGPAVFAGMNALAAAKRVHVPVLFGYGAKDTAFATGVRQVRAATASRDKPLVTVGDQTHGAALVDLTVGYAKVRQAVLRFIRATTHG